jgi:hypothetical protein
MPHPGEPRIGQAQRGLTRPGVQRPVRGLCHGTGPAAAVTALAEADAPRWVAAPFSLPALPRRIPGRGTACAWPWTAGRRRG